MTPFDITTAKQVPMDGTLWVTPAGDLWKKINNDHPERRQWMKRKASLTQDGYHRYKIAGRKWTAHRLVYSLFVDALNPSLVVCHIDGNGLNNDFRNLEQQTQRVNMSHKRRHGTHLEGQDHPGAVHSAESITRAKKLLGSAQRSKTGRIRRGEHRRISLETGVSINTLHAIASRNGWASV